MKNINKKLLISISIFVILIFAVVIYINDYYHASKIALECINKPSNGVTVKKDGDTFCFEPDSDIKAGIIFYPGGKVEEESYAPMMEALAQKGYLSVIVGMPANLAVLDSNGADGIQNQYKDVDRWYMSGHSLGGSMAASYIGDNDKKFEGLILLAAYSIDNLSKSDIDVLSIYGSEDGVLNMEKYKKNIANLPSDYKEVVIDGGCHAYFGCYGEQKGDGSATITNEEQIKITADKIDDFICK